MKYFLKRQHITIPRGAHVSAVHSFSPSNFLLDFLLSGLEKVLHKKVSEDLIEEQCQMFILNLAATM
jgi:hypothetical protein